MKKKFFIFIATLFFASFLNAEDIIEFYNTESSSADIKMIGMTTDLYFNQLQNANGYSIVDKRNSNYNTLTKTKSGISFYAQIEQSEDDSNQWTCTLHAIDGKNDKEASIVKNYESYYKILLDAKQSINSLLASLSSNPSIKSKETPSPLNIHDLYGTWDAENSVNKIVIMQNSKGFIIFDNGTSMNISVTVNGSDITINQIDKSDPRNNAMPTTWNLKKSENGILQGKKVSGGQTTEVKWIKR